MSVIQIIGGFLLLALCVVVIAAVVMQESPKGGLGTIAGESSTFFDRNRGKTKEAMLVRATSICGVALAVLTLVLLFVI